MQFKNALVCYWQNPMFYKGADYLFVMFHMTDQQTIHNAKKLVSFFDKSKSTHARNVKYR